HKKECAMNYGRLAAAAVAAAVVDMVYGFVVYGMLLQGQFNQYRGIYRPPEDMSYMAYLMLGILIGTFTATYIYAKGYEGGAGALEGARFGACIGVFVGAYIGLVNYAVMNLGRRITLSRSEEHTSELQSRFDLVCRLLLDKN